MGNYAFIDGQNLHLGTHSQECSWNIDFKKLRIYLKDKYHVEKAFYYIGYVSSENQELYTLLQEAGFIIQFKKQTEKLVSQKKGNIDSDLIFNVMQHLLEKSECFEKIVLISGDGDFKILVDYLIKKWRFEKILFPSKKFASSLYKKLGSIYYDYLINVKNKIEYKKSGQKKEVP